MPSSTTSSTHSEIESLKDLLGNEETRYVRKGYGLIMACILAFSFFVVLPQAFFPLYQYIAQFPRFYISVIGNYVIHFVTFTIANLVMYLIYRMELPFFERYKILQQDWPWNTQPEEFRGQLKKTFKMMLLNQGVILPFWLLVTYYLNLDTYVVNIEEYPSWGRTAVQILFFMIAEDTYFYWAHRALHHKRFYSQIHKIHHEYKTTIGITSEYAHPFEFLFVNIVAVCIGPALLGNCHIVTNWMWMVLRILETTDGHCGYEFSWSPFRLLPLSGSANYHNYHHSHNVGNFGSFFTYWDTICKTNAHYWRHMIKLDKQE